MFERARAWLAVRLRGRPFEAFQIEVTSRCTLRCVMCPRVALADQWPARDLPWEGFQRIAPALRHAKFVHLQGWGEPLLHPRLFDMIAAAKAAGCRVGFTTNAMLLDQGAREQLLALDVDLVAISIAGATRETHEGIRRGSDFRRPGGFGPAPTGKTAASVPFLDVPAASAKPAACRAQDLHGWSGTVAPGLLTRGSVR